MQRWSGSATLLVTVVLLGASASPTPAAEQQAVAPPAARRHFDLEQTAKLVRVADPQIAPDGRSIVVVVSRQDLEANKWESQLVRVDIADGAQRVLTPARKRVSHPRWSPSGDRLAFLAPAGDGKDAKYQIFVLPMNGGEAQRITDAAEGVLHFAWRPDGGAIAYAAADEPADKKAREKGEDAFEVGNDDMFIDAAPLPAHVWLVPADGGEAHRLTSGAWSLPVSLPPSSPASPLAWSPDGKLLALVKQATPHDGDADQTTVQVLDVASGQLHALTGKSRFEGFPSFAPDGSSIAYWAFRDRDPNNVNDVFVAPSSGGEGINLAVAIDRNFTRSIWLPDGKSLLLGANDGTKVSLWIVPLHGPSRKLNLGPAVPSNPFWVDATVGRDGAVAFCGSEGGHPVELYFMASPDSPPRRLTDFNRETAALDLGRVETIEWQGPDHFHEDGVLIYPPGYQPGSKLPLVLLIHGGPQAASTAAFSPLGQLIAARGYLVFQPNYRGSDNLGNGYQRAIFNDAGDGPGRDVMAGLDAVKKRAIVDEGRIAVSGWSYGGYMTTWLIGHYQGWKAAVAGAAVTDLADEYNLGDYNVQNHYGFPGSGSPWRPDSALAYRQQSPITYASVIRTPTLIMSDTGDARVPPVQSFKLFRALRDNGVTTRFVAYPVTGHFPGDPVRSRDVYRRWIEWLDTYLAASSPAH
ncbi:MAG: S9 family peptidase [Thermoanaerobaculales bacterium]